MVSMMMEREQGDVYEPECFSLDCDDKDEAYQCDDDDHHNDDDDDYNSDDDDHNDEYDDNYGNDDDDDDDDDDDVNDEKGTFVQRVALESCTWAGPPLVGWRPEFF